MANVRVEQRNAHLASPVRLETVTGREGEVSKATLTAISDSRRGSGDSREDEPTAIQWTLWGVGLSARSHSRGSRSCFPSRCA